jgi:hypothetical protein
VVVVTTSVVESSEELVVSTIPRVDSESGIGSDVDALDEVVSGVEVPLRSVVPIGSSATHMPAAEPANSPKRRPDGHDSSGKEHAPPGSHLPERPQLACVEHSNTGWPQAECDSRSPTNATQRRMQPRVYAIVVAARARPSTPGYALRLSRSIAAWTIAALLTACTFQQSRRLERRHGDAMVRDRRVAEVPTDTVDYWSQVRPILAARCVVCHGCYDAPCQVKLGSIEGIERGATTAKVYDALRLRETAPTRLFEDAQSTEAWREMGFHPIVNERAQTVAGNREAGLMLQLLELKRAHPLPGTARLPDDIDVTMGRDEKCPTIEELPRHVEEHPQWGMPYGLPGLSTSEHDTLTRWLEAGALHTAPPPLPKAVAAQVKKWEAFLNVDSPKARIAGRYIYEHLFLAHLYFADEDRSGAPHFFELVRSRTPPGHPIDRIATRRPYDDPGVARPFYRLQEVRESVVAKLHLPYRLDAARMRRWRELFLDADYEVSKLPSYAPEVASNPFVAFAAIPVDSRYRFMLDEAEFTIMGFIKGAVCRGPIALNVIQDQFYIFFADPDVDTQLHDAKFLLRHADALRMPAEAGSNAGPMVTWLRDATRQKRWMEAKRKAVREDFGGRPVVLDALWDGDGHNSNAALTVFRNYDSAAVVRGMVGGPPKTAWVLGYPLLERIHYLLVAGFDVFGNAGHQLATRTYMDFLRMEAEFAFLAFLPPRAREKERAFWYRDTNERIYGEVVGQVDDIDVDTAIRYATAKPKLELYDMLRSHYAKVIEDRYALESSRLPDASIAALRGLGAVAGASGSRLPELAFVYVPDAPHGPEAFSLIRNAAHSNISSPLQEQKRRVPAEDTLSIAHGFIGTYPNALFVVPRAQLPAFVEQVRTLASETDYAALITRFGVRRTDPAFWTTSDRIHALFRDRWPIEAGMFDLSRLENR